MDMISIDNDTNRLILNEILNGCGASVLATAYGQRALAMLKEAKIEGAPFQILLLDCRMPNMDGFSVAENGFISVQGHVDAASEEVPVIHAEEVGSTEPAGQNVVTVIP